MSECCLLFKVHHKKEYEYVYSKLDCIIDVDDIKSLYVHKDNDITKEAVNAAKIISLLPDGFSDTLNFHMKKLSLATAQLSEASLVSQRTITRMRSPKSPNPTVESIVAVSIGMNLYPELSFDMLHKADREFDFTDPAHIWYMVILRTMYKENIAKCNELLYSNGILSFGM